MYWLIKSATSLLVIIIIINIQIHKKDDCICFQNKIYTQKAYAKSFSFSFDPGSIRINMYATLVSHHRIIVHMILTSEKLGKKYRKAEDKYLYYAAPYSLSIIIKALLRSSKRGAALWKKLQNASAFSQQT